MNRQERIEALRQCEDSCMAAREAVIRFCRIYARQPGLVLPFPYKLIVVERSVQELEQAFQVRLFAEFEATIRDYWRKGCRKKSNPQIKQLIGSLASRLHSPTRWHDNVHIVRDVRNSIVHSAAISPISLATARSHLCRFLSLLPSDW